MRSRRKGKRNGKWEKIRGILDDGDNDDDCDKGNCEGDDSVDDDCDGDVDNDDDHNYHDDDFSIMMIMQRH